MIAYSPDCSEQVADTHEIIEIAKCLSNNFLKSLYHSRNKGNYFVYVGCVAEILDWAYEFYNTYKNSNNDRESFKFITYGINNNLTRRDDLLITWGSERLKQFFARNEK